MKKMLIGLAIAAAATGVTTTGITTTANAASTACGSSCFELNSLQYGPGYLAAASSAVTGQAVKIAPSGPLPSEDFHADYLGRASENVANGVVSAAIARSWPDGPVFQFVFTPGGVTTSLCIGVAGIAQNGTPVTLQPCGTPQHTIWVAIPENLPNGYAPLISDTALNTSDPQVLTANAEIGPLTTESLVINPAGSIPVSDQMWVGSYGVARTYPVLGKLPPPR